MGEHIPESRESILKRQNVTKLHLSAKHGETSEIERLLQNRNCKVDEETSKGWTALMIASSKGHKEIVDLLLKKGADSEKQKDGWNAIQLAEFYGHTEVSDVFKKYEKAKNSDTSRSNTLIHKNDREAAKRKIDKTNQEDNNERHDVKKTHFYYLRSAGIRCP